MDASEGWRRSVYSASPLLAILDDGFYVGHADLDQAIGDRHCDFGEYPEMLPVSVPIQWQCPGEMTRECHGTAVAGVAAAQHNDIDIPGIYRGKIWALRVVGKRNGNDVVSPIRIAAALRFAWEHGARVINLSVIPKLEANSTLDRTIEEIGTDSGDRRGALVVVASGNEGVEVTERRRPNYWFETARPHNFMSVMAVGANLEAIQSNYGCRVDIAAPANVCSLGRQRDYTCHFGSSSAAAPHVAAAAALLLGVPQFSACSASDLRHVLLVGRRPLGGQAGHNIAGGMVSLHFLRDLPESCHAGGCCVDVGTLRECREGAP
jgi:subtilisin family serine protease